MKKVTFQLVVYRSSETSTYQSDLIIRSDDRFLNLVVDSDSIVSKIYMLNERLVTRDGQTDGRDYEITSCLINY